MSDEELKRLEKEVRKAKRIVSERASELHDLVEDRLPAGYRDLPGIAEACYQACIAWAEADTKLKAVEAANSQQR